MNTYALNHSGVELELCFDITSEVKVLYSRVFTSGGRFLDSSRFKLGNLHYRGDIDHRKVFLQMSEFYCTE